MSYVASQQNPFDSNNLNKQILFNDFFKSRPKLNIVSIEPLNIFTSANIIYDNKLFYIGDLKIITITPNVQFQLDILDFDNINILRIKSDILSYSSVDIPAFSTYFNLKDIIFSATLAVNITKYIFTGYKIQVE